MAAFTGKDEWDFSKSDPPEALGQGKSVAIVNVPSGIQSLEGSAVETTGDLLDRWGNDYRHTKYQS